MGRLDYELELTEFRAALRDKTAIPGDNFRQPDFQDVRFGAYSVVDEGSVASTVESTAVRPYVARFFLKDYVGFVFSKTGRDVRIGNGEWRHVPNHSISVAAYTNSSFEVLRPAGHKIATATVYVQRDYLVDYYGLKVENLPEQCHDVFRGRPNARFLFNSVLTARAVLAVEAIFRCTMAEPLKSLYLGAKYQELLSETVDAFNRCGKAGIGKLMSKSTRERNLIETAAQIYRRNLGNAPSIAELALKLGINRNKLVDGFKEVYGTGPGDYAKGIRLDWAKEQLVSGVMTIGEAAHATGYSNPSAFARAYGEHFGKLPSSDRSLEPIPKGAQ